MSSAARRFPVQGAAGTALDSSSSSLHLPSAASGDLHVPINTNPRPDYYLPHRAPVASHLPNPRYSRPPQRIFDLRAPRPLHRNSGNDPSSQPVTTFGGAHPPAASFDHTSAWQSLPYPASVSCMQQSESVDSTGTLSFGPVPAAGLAHRQDSLVAGSPWSGPPTDWIMSQPSFGGPVEPFVQQQQIQSHRGRRSHQRTPSASTITTAHSASPFEPHLVGGFPRIANAEFSPEAAALQAQFDAQFLNKSFPLDPSALLAPTPNHAYMTNPSNSAHQAMQAFAIDHHIADDREPDFTHSSRHSISTPDNASPATPPHGAPDAVEAPSVNVSANDATPNGYRPPHSNLQLFRTESQAYQDELYNPPQENCTSTPAKKSTSTFLSPHQAVMSERLQAANDIRSQSPASVMSRERSPFREGVQLAYGGEWRSPGGMGTAAGLRRYQKEQAEQAEYARTRGQVQPEQTKTISPKDAQLELHDVDHPSLFQDSVPMGYKQHNTGVDAWTQGLVDGGDVSFGFQTPPVTTSFRQDIPVSNPAEAFSFVNLAHNTTFDASQLPNASFRSSAYPVTSIKTNPYLAQADAAPAFPATLTSMESSISDTGPSSSADDIATTVQRPADTRANTGTYTCTYHGCTQRFDSHANLQRHKREVHRSVHQHLSVEPQSSPHPSSTASSGGATPSDASSRSTASPDPSAIGMTSAAIMARNSQAGPHKCTRINPSTGKPCNTIFSRPYDLTRHEDTIHNARKQKVRCPLCREEKTFSRNDALTRHMRVVHPEVESFGKRGRRD